MRKWFFYAIAACLACGTASNSETAATPPTPAADNAAGAGVATGSGMGGDGTSGATATGASTVAAGGGMTGGAGSDGLPPDSGGLVADTGQGGSGLDARSPEGGVAPSDSGFVLPSMTIEGLQVAGTHNSYHIAPLIAFDASHKYTHVPLDQQLAGGLRAFELDLHLRADGVFEIYHIAIIDTGTTCATLDDCLGVIATWSSAHPKHTPITIWFELKDDTGGNMITDIVPVEQVITKVFAKDKLITPVWLRGSYASPHERITMAGWPTLQEAQGKIMFAIITRDARTQQYSHDFTSLDDRLIWVNPTPDQFSMPWAAITKVEDLTLSSDIAAAHTAHLLVDANTCAVNLTDDQCQMRATTAITSGVHMLHDDLPFAVQGRAYSLKLPKGSPGCNPVTAPASCDPSMLE